MIRTALLVVGLMPLAACKEEPVKVEPPQHTSEIKTERQSIPGVGAAGTARGVTPGAFHRRGCIACVSAAECHSPR